MLYVWVLGYRIRPLGVILSVHDTPEPLPGLEISHQSDNPQNGAD